jgi:TM2 domain-containing membrane protein YozV
MTDFYDQCSDAFNRDDAFATSPEGKSRGVTALLAIVLGCLGVHYFYLGKPFAGIVTILLNFITSGIFYLLILIQGILMFLMHNHTFREKYVLNPSKFPLY